MGLHKTASRNVHSSVIQAAEKWQWPRHPATDERTHQMCSAHTTGYDVVVKRNEAVAHARDTADEPY